MTLKVTDLKIVKLCVLRSELNIHTRELNDNLLFSLEALVMPDVA